MDSFKRSYVYFFPVVFFPFLNIFQFRNDVDIKSWLFRNLLVSFIVILIPLFLNLSMIITKFLYKDQDKNTEYRAIGLGLLCFIFLTGINYYQFQKFTVGTDGEFKHEVRQFQKPYDNQQAEQISLMV